MVPINYNYTVNFRLFVELLNIFICAGELVKIYDNDTGCIILYDSYSPLIGGLL